MMPGDGKCDGSILRGERLSGTGLTVVLAALRRKARNVPLEFNSVFSQVVKQASCMRSIVELTARRAGNFGSLFCQIGDSAEMFCQGMPIPRRTGRRRMRKKGQGASFMSSLARTINIQIYTSVPSIFEQKKWSRRVGLAWLLWTVSVPWRMSVKYLTRAEI
jgi:hypothetical protein